MPIRTATAQDAAAVEGLRLGTWQVAYRSLVPDPFLDALQVTEQSLTRWAARLDDPEVTTWVAEQPGIVGMAVAGPCRDADLIGRRELYALYVDAGSWRGGVGSALLEAAKPVEVLWVLAGNARARAFYERHGFAPDGTSKQLDLGGPIVEVRYRR